MFLLFSHTLSREQRLDGEQNLDVGEFVSLDAKLQRLWSDISPEIESLKSLLEPFKEFLKSNAKKGDFVLIQGDFGASYEMVCFSKKLGLVPIYATTKRMVSEENQSEKIIKKSIFIHRRFREYGV